MAVCNDCPYYDKCDYAGEAFAGTDREVRGCQRDVYSGFVGTANGVCLDKLGIKYGVERNKGKDDESYRARITPVWEEVRKSLTVKPYDRINKKGSD